MTQAWVSPLRSRASPRVRLFCLPFAGGGAAVFRDWPADLPDDVEVWTVNLPGRERRIAEPAIDDAGRLARAVSEALLSVAEPPYALFGHSMGALVGFEAVRALRERGHPPPCCLFVSGHRAPELPLPHAPLHALPREELLAELHRLNGTPADVLANAELVDLFLPMLRADFRAVETDAYVAGAPLESPIVAFRGADDDEVPLDHVAAWRAHTTAVFAVHTVPGDHFFLLQRRREVTSLVARDLAYFSKCSIQTSPCSSV